MESLRAWNRWGPGVPTSFDSGGLSSKADRPLLAALHGLPGSFLPTDVGKVGGFASTCDLRRPRLRPDVRSSTPGVTGHARWRHRSWPLTSPSKLTRGHTLLRRPVDLSRLPPSVCWGAWVWRFGREAARGARAGARRGQAQGACSSNLGSPRGGSSLEGGTLAGAPRSALHHSRTSKWTPSRLSSQLCWASSAVPCSRSAVGLSSLGPGVSEPPTLDHSGSCWSGGRAALGKCREHPPRDVLLPFNPLTTEEGRRVAWNPKQAGELAVPRGCGEWYDPRFTFLIETCCVCFRGKTQQAETN